MSTRQTCPSEIPCPLASSGVAGAVDEHQAARAGGAAGVVGRELLRVALPGTDEPLPGIAVLAPRCVWAPVLALVDGRAIHPGNTMNSWIATVMADLLFPRGLRPSFLGGAFGLQSPGANPHDFKIGVNLARCTPAEGFPGALDGAVLTVRSPDDLGMQIAWDYASSTALMPAVRFGQGGVWKSWISRPHVDLVALNGWVEWAVGTSVRASQSWKLVSLSGALKNGTVTVGTVVCTLPVGMRPAATQWFTVPCGATFDQLAVLQVQVDGDVAVQVCPANAGLSLSGITFEAFN